MNEVINTDNNYKEYKKIAERFGKKKEKAIEKAVEKGKIVTDITEEELDI